MSGRLDRVKIEIGEETVVMPWAVRDELGMAGVRAKLEAVGASRPAEMLAVRALVSAWEDDVEAPAVIVALGVAIDEELDRKRAEAGEIGIGGFDSPG